MLGGNRSSYGFDAKGEMGSADNFKPLDSEAQQDAQW